METGIFKTLATFQYPHEAAIVQGRLQALGLECFLKDELTVQAYHFLSNAIGGVKLQVKESDFERAKQLLNNAHVPMELPPQGAGESISPGVVCPFCGSDNTGRAKEFSP